MKTIQDLSKETGVPANKIRKVLRGNGMNKETPYYWVWNDDKNYLQIKNLIISSVSSKVKSLTTAKRP